MLPEAIMNFKLDFTRMAKHKLIELGVPVLQVGKIENPIYQWLNLQIKMIEPLPRSVYFSKEFTCPQKLQKGLDCLIERINDGMDINNYLSKKVHKPDEKDELLYDWNIHHLHLGLANETTSRYIQRTGPVLFVRFESHGAYFINVYEHGSWSKLKLLETIHQNWPHLIARHKLPIDYATADGANPFVADEDCIKLFRKNGIVTTITMSDGTCYFPPGMGLNADGSSTKIRLHDMRISNTLALYELHIKENLQTIVNEWNLHGMSKIRFCLWIEDSKIYAFEPITRQCLYLSEMNRLGFH